MFSILHLNPNFDKKLERSFTIIKEISHSLDMKDCSSASFICALADLNQREELARLKQNKLSDLLSNIQSINNDLSENLTLLDCSIKNQQEAVFEKEARANEWSNNINIMMLKKDEYTEKKRDLEQTIADFELNENRVCQLQVLETDIVKLNDLVESKENKLISFVDLDPDLVKAKLKLGEKVMEFNLLVEKRERIFSNLK